MGIRGLLTFIENNMRLFDIVDLVPKRTNQYPIEILVDCHSFMPNLIEIISTKISNEYNNNNPIFPSMEFDIFKNAISEFHTVFKNAGINLVWILDSPKVFKCAF